MLELLDVRGRFSKNRMGRREFSLLRQGAAKVMKEDELSVRFEFDGKGM